MDLFGIFLKVIIEGGFIVLIIRFFFLGIVWIRYKKYSVLKLLNCIRNYLDEIIFCFLLLIIIDNIIWFDNLVKFLNEIFYWLWN